jgi:poly(A) polymerase
MNNDQIHQISTRVANSFIARLAEKEVERLLRDILPGSRFKGKIHAVGGYVRDELLGIPSKDLDAVIDMKNGAEKFTKWIHSLFRKETSRPMQLGNYPIWAINFKDSVEYNGKIYETGGADIEVADTMKESFPDENSRQRQTMPGTLSDDIERRDFTVNMLLKDLTTGQLKDLSGTSASDIKKGILRGHPGVDFEKIIKEDPLRMMRLVRFQAKYGWKVPYSVLKIIKNNAKRINIVSSERIRDELIKLMKIGKLKHGIKMMKTLNLLRYVFPEIQEMIGVDHDKSRGHHQEGDVYNHTLLVLQNAKPGVIGQLSALLHDVGKPKTQEILADKITFLGHEGVGAEMAEAIMRRLGFTKKVITKVKSIVKNHMRPHGLVGDNVSQKALRKFVRNVGEEMVEAILDQAEADQLGNLPPNNQIPVLRKKIEDAMKIPIEEKSLIDGRTIMQILGLKKGGKIIGEVLEFVKEMQDEYAGKGKVLSPEEAKKLIRIKYT